MCVYICIYARYFYNPFCMPVKHLLRCLLNVCICVYFIYILNNVKMPLQHSLYIYIISIYMYINIIYVNFV